MFPLQPLDLPVVEPVTVQELAYNLRLIATPITPCPEYEVEYLNRLIATARQEAENYTGCYWVEQGFKAFYPHFVALQAVDLALTEVISLEYYNAQNVLVTLPTDNYYLTLGQVRLIENAVVPTLYPRLDAVVMSYKVGNRAVVPAPVKQAIILSASHFYENREATGVGEVKEIPLSYRWLLDSYRKIIV